jgi:hypothetical protein
MTQASRLATYDVLPHRGLPDRLMGWEEYRRTVDVLETGIAEAATKMVGHPAVRSLSDPVNACDGLVHTS